MSSSWRPVNDQSFCCASSAKISFGTDLFNDADQEPRTVIRHWYYEDFVRPAAVNPSLLPSYSLKAFSLLMFRSCPLLHDVGHPARETAPAADLCILQLIPDHSRIWTSFMAYKERVPVCGAILINQYWDKVRLPGSSDNVRTANSALKSRSCW